MAEQISFFLGANTPFGFHSLYSELYDPQDGWTAYILKGGPGMGKSTLMKRVAAACANRSIPCEIIRCASDPGSLDAVRIESGKVCIADGTAPHTIDPRYPGAAETVLDLSAYLDEAPLRQDRAEVIRLFTENASQHARAVRFLQAAESLSRDIRRLALQNTDTEKIERYASRFAARRFGAPRGTIGTEKKRFLSAVTPDGVYIHRNTADTLCDELVVIDDPYGAVSAVLLGALRRYALGAGLDVIACLHPLHPDAGPQHLLLPQIRLGIVTANTFQHWEGTSTVHASRFIDTAALRSHRSRITFSRRTEKELLEEAVAASHNALTVHDALEAHYRRAMDYTAVDALAERVTDEILSFCAAWA